MLHQRTDSQGEGAVVAVIAPSADESGDLARRLAAFDMTARAAVGPDGVEAADLVVVYEPALDHGVFRHRPLLDRARAPIVFLVGQSEEADRILTLEFGADDVLPATLSTRELVARLRSLLRRSRAPVARAPIGGDTGWRLYPDRQLLTGPGGLEYGLTGAETDLLRILAEAGGRMMSRTEAIERYGRVELGSRSVDTLVSRLRGKLRNADVSLIRTVRGRGYALTAPVEVVVPTATAA